MVEIVEVLTKAQRRAFVQFPNDLYRGVPQYIPGLRMDELGNLEAKTNPAFDYCEVKLWLAYKEGKIAGRVAGIINRAANEKMSQKRIRVSRIDFIDDFEVSSALVKTVEKWGAENGMTEIHGPIGFNDLDRQGMLVDGFHLKGMFITIYNFPYYVEHFEKMGFVKDIDWVETKIYTDGAEERAAKLDRICKRVLERTNTEIFYVKNKRQLAPYVEKLLGLVNEAFAPLYGVVPLPPRQMEYTAKQYTPLISLQYLPIIMKDGEPIAFGLIAPSFADAMKKNGGRLFPFGWIPLLRAIKKPETLDMYLIAVKPEYQKSGLPAVILNEVTRTARKNGIKSAETGPELETNYQVQGLWEGYHTDYHHKRRRCWVKQIKA